jgi:hypothetical protein
LPSQGLRQKLPDLPENLTVYPFHFLHVIFGLQNHQKNQNKIKELEAQREEIKRQLNELSDHE